MPRGSKEICYEDLKLRILRMDLEPGVVLEEASLAARYALSRTPLREVLQRLAGVLPPKTGNPLKSMLCKLRKTRLQIVRRQVMPQRPRSPITGFTTSSAIWRATYILPPRLTGFLLTIHG